MPSGRAARLRIEFPAAYPWFPPHVFDPNNDLSLGRHRSPIDGRLCLIEEYDWHLDTTAATHLTEQLPLLLAIADKEHHGDLDESHGTRDIEINNAEPTGEHLAPGTPAITMQYARPPARLTDGALLARLRLGRDGTVLAATLENVLGEGFNAANPIDPVWLRNQYPYLLTGRWIRMNDFNPADSSDRTWARVRDRLRPVATLVDKPETAIDSDSLTLVGLLVPSEQQYRTVGERWIFLLAAYEKQPSGRKRLRTWYVDAQECDWTAANVRTPDGEQLLGRSVAIVGVGAIGSTVLTDLARSGVRTLTVIDRDVVDATGTAARQPAPLIFAGIAKAHLVARQILTEHPMVSIDTHVLGVGNSSGHAGPATAEVSAQAISALRAADLVIDAAANAPLTRWLAALRKRDGKALIHVSATSGGWGGVVAHLRAGRGCWSCIEHWRNEKHLPAPPHDPHGLVELVGCSESTFTGHSADIASVAHHASRVAINSLTRGHALDQDYYVASLRDPEGHPQPVAWSAHRINPHPSCPLHVTSIQ